MRNNERAQLGKAQRTSSPNSLKSLTKQSWHAACIYIGYTFQRPTEDTLTPEIVEITIISLAFGTALGYLIGIVKHIIDNGGRLNMDWI